MNWKPLLTHVGYESVTFEFLKATCTRGVYLSLNHAMHRYYKCIPFTTPVATGAWVCLSMNTLILRDLNALSPISTCSA